MSNKRKIKEKVIEYEGDPFVSHDDQFDWDKAVEYYQTGKLETELKQGGSEWFDPPVNSKKLLSFYFNNEALIRAVVDRTLYLLNNSSLANEIRLAIERIES